MSALKPGDILVFKAGDNWISKSIAWLTDSDVSHSAIMLNDGQMAEMGSGGIYVSKVEARDCGEDILLRLSPEKRPEPLLAAAQKYIDCETRYDFPILAFLAGLIIYRRIRPTPQLTAITDTILKAACVALDKLIQKVILKNPNKAMVCSQLVYQIYYDCGEDYRIIIENGLLQRGASAVDSENDTLRLADIAQNQSDSVALDDDTDFPSDEALAQELYMALTEDAQPVVTDLGSLPSSVTHFLEKLDAFLEKSKSNIPLNSMFVAPSDLAYNAKNLDTISKLEIVRM